MKFIPTQHSIEIVEVVSLLALHIFEPTLILWLALWVLLFNIGHHLESLRQLRLNREGRKDSLAQQPTRDRFSVFNQAVSSQQEQPKLERLTTECNFEFRGQDMLESEDLMAGKKLKLSLECRGTDVIGGVNDLVTAEVIDQGQRWVSSLPTAGKNKLTLLARY